LSSVAENSSRCPARGDAVQQPGDGRQEAHVSHVVGLIDHGESDRVQRAGSLLQQIGQPTGSGDDHVDASPEGLDLRAHRRATVDREQAQAQCSPQRGELVVDLAGQLASRHQHQGPRAVAAGIVRAWMGRGAVIPRRASTAVRAAGTPSSSKALLRVDVEGFGIVGARGTWNETPFMSRMDASARCNVRTIHAGTPAAYERST
jgi:hypothetical protein